MQNVKTEMLGWYVRHMTCPNEELTDRMGIIEGVYLEDGRLMLVVLFLYGEKNKLETVPADHVEVFKPKEKL